MIELQLALIIIIIFTFQIFFSERSERNNQVKIIRSILLGLSILLCMSFRLMLTLIPLWKLRLYYPSTIVLLEQSFQSICQ